MNLKKYRPYLITAAIIFLIMLSGVFSSETPENIRSIICGSLIAIVVVLTIPIYDINRWSLPKQSFVHFLLMAVTILPLVMISGWHDWSTLGGFSAMLGVFLLSGVVLWTIGYTVNHFIEKHHKK